jgi:hypothetical protein
MSDVIPLTIDTPKDVARQLVVDTLEDDVSLVAVTLASDGSVRIHANPMSSDRMFYLGGLIQNFVLNKSA